MTNSRTAGQARDLIGKGTSMARSAFNNARPFLAPVAGVAGLGLAPFDIKDRLDQGADIQRAVQETAASNGGGWAGFVAGAKAGAMVPGSPQLKTAAAIGGGLVGGLVGSNVSGWVNDRVTDMFRGNDGKAPDKVIRDMVGQRDAAAMRGDSIRAADLSRQIEAFTKAQQRRMASPQDQTLYGVADQIGLSSGAIPQFRQNKDALEIDLYSQGRYFNQELDQKSRGVRRAAEDELYQMNLQEPVKQMIRQNISNLKRGDKITEDMSDMLRAQGTNQSANIANYMNSLFGGR